MGLAVLMGCKAAGATKLIAIDLNPEKEKAAREFGATEFINPKDLPGEEGFLHILLNYVYYYLKCYLQPDLVVK